MFKVFYSSKDERLLERESNLMFKEISDGIYFIIKDKFSRYTEEYVSSSQVLVALNNYQNVAVVSHGSGSGYANWNFDRP